jgi:arylsulfatase B
MMNPGSVGDHVLQRYINDQTDDAYATAVVGKWHLAGESTSFNPESLGIDYYAGLIRGAVQSYYQWQLTEDGAGSLQTDYTTEVFTDLAIDWVNEQNQPWFLWLAYTAPHTPFHVPPAEMHSQGDLPEYAMGMDPMPYYLAAIEAMDYQIGRLLDAIPEEELDNTVVIFLGDNGTPNQVAQGPYTSNTVKGTLYQGGINVPLYVTGKGVSRTGEETSLVGSTDLFCTIAELAGVNVPEIHDSKSFIALLSEGGAHRDFQYSEMNDGNQDLWTISNGNYKLIVYANGAEEMYDLANDPYESSDLLEGTLTPAEANAKLELEAELATIRD